MEAANTSPEPKLKQIPGEPQVRKPVDPNWSDAELENYKLHRRFDRIGRLIGDSSMKRLMDAQIAQHESASNAF